MWEISRTHLLELDHDVKIGEVQPSCGKLLNDNMIECIVNRNLFNIADSYQLHITHNSIKVSAGSLAGLHYAVCTFVQILRLSKNQSRSEVCEIEPVFIKDEPRFAHRGILLDISPRGRVPTLEYLLHIIDILSSFKISHLHLYSRLVQNCDWQLCYSKSEMITLDRYCRYKLHICIILRIHFSNKRRFLIFYKLYYLYHHSFHCVIVFNCDLFTYLLYNLRFKWRNFYVMSFGNFFRDRHLDIVPTLDVDSNVSQHHLMQMWPIFQDLLAVFPSLNYVHVGPRLTTLLVQADSFDLSVSVNDTLETDMSEVFKSYSCLQELWHILNLSSNTTLLLCSNSLHSKSEFHNIPTNIILVEYGFQVS